MMDARTSDEIDALDAWIRQRGAVHISGRELCTVGRNRVIVAPPPREMWGNIIPTIEVFEDLRAIVGHPLIVSNGYRPKDANKAVGGSRFSAHISFRALDLDLPNEAGTWRNQITWYRTCASYWLDHGKDKAMGLGLYAPHGGSRVHIDTHHKPWPLFRSYRCWHKRFVDPIVEGLR